MTIDKGDEMTKFERFVQITVMLMYITLFIAAIGGVIVGITFVIGII